MVRIRGQKIRRKRQKKKYVIIGAGAVAVLAAVTLIAEGISYFSAETVDTKEGLAIIKAAEKENVCAAVFFVCPRSCPLFVRSCIGAHGIVSQNAANVHLRIPCIDIFHKKFIFLL